MEKVREWMRWRENYGGNLKLSTSGINRVSWDPNFLTRVIIHNFFSFYPDSRWLHLRLPPPSFRPLPLPDSPPRWVLYLSVRRCSGSLCRLLSMFWAAISVRFSRCFLLFRLVSFWDDESDWISVTADSSGPVFFTLIRSFPATIEG